MFARKRQVDPTELVEASEQQTGQAPNPWAEKALAMFGVSMTELQQKGAEVKAILDDYRERLQRCETKLDLVQADLAELIEMAREGRLSGQREARLDKK